MRSRGEKDIHRTQRCVSGFGVARSWRLTALFTCPYTNTHLSDRHLRGYSRDTPPRNIQIISLSLKKQKNKTKLLRDLSSTLCKRSDLSGAFFDYLRETSVERVLVCANCENQRKSPQSQQPLNFLVTQTEKRPLISPRRAKSLNFK